MDSDTEQNGAREQTLSAELIKRLAKTPFCRPAIAELAEDLADLTPETAECWIDELTDRGEDLALNTLLVLCAFRQLYLDPEILAGSAGVVADIMYVPYVFANQDSRAVGPLVEMACSEELSRERQALLARLATELTLRYDDDHDFVRTLLYHQCEEIRAEPVVFLVHDTMALLLSGKLEPKAFPIMIDFDIHAALPERPERKVIGGGGTVRRPIAKLSRNDPCHCGSGKKYKRCCHEKDQEILADASEYEGLTQTQIRENPAIVDDPKLIESLRAYELKKLDPETLSPAQLFAAYRRACDFNLFALALDMLVRRAEYTDAEPPFDRGHFLDLMDQALDAGDLGIARQARDLAPRDNDLVDWDDVDMQFKLNEDPGLVGMLEARCREALNPPDDVNPMLEHDFCGLSHTFHRKFPALSILFARAAVQQMPDRWLDNEFLVEKVHQARIDIGLDPWGDPIDELFDAAEDDFEDKRRDVARDTREAELQDELTQTREQARATRARLSEAEGALKSLNREVERYAAKEEQPKREATPASQAELEVTREKAAKLRRQVDNLKAEIGNQQEARRQLRNQLEKERQRAQRAEKGIEIQSPAQEDEPAEMPSEKARTPLIPEYENAFREACDRVPSAVARSALKTIGGFAAYDNAVWRHTRTIKQLSDIYRVRIGMHYRLLLRWVPGQTVMALDLIPRQDLETWIRRHLS